jgi:hypothetical protein
MPAQSRLLDLALVAHEAVEKPTQWAVFLARLAEELDAHRTAIVSRGLDGLPVEVVSASRGATEGPLERWLENAGCAATIRSAG